MTDDELIAAKAAARAAALAHRGEVVAEADAGARLAAVVLAACAPPGGAMVSGFWPIGDEIDVRPLLLALHGRGHDLCLPETTKRGQVLVFRRWRPGDTLVAGRFGTSHPAGEAVTPDFLLVPLLAFDGDGRRLGYGGGYYDRTMAGIPRAFRLGVAFASQQVALVPAGPRDVTLHAVATERGIVRAAAGSGR